jgi:hypothetical protein
MASCFGVEIYGNTVSHPNSSMAFFKQRSGQTRVFNNTIIGGPSQAYIYPYSGTSENQCPLTYVEDKLTHNSYFWGNRKDYTGALWNLVPATTIDCSGILGVPMPGRDIFADDPVYDFQSALSHFGYADPRLF